MPGSGESMNVKGAYLEVWADMLGSVGVIIGALIIKLTGWTLADPIIAVLIGLWVLPRTWTLLREAGQILMQARLRARTWRRSAPTCSRSAGSAPCTSCMSGRWAAVSRS